MQFVNKRKSNINQLSHNNNNNININNSLMPMSSVNRPIFKIRDNVPPGVISERSGGGGGEGRSSTQPNNIINNVIKEDRPKTMKWGQPTWFFLHTIAEKVNENSFPNIRRELLDIILKILNAKDAYIAIEDNKQSAIYAIEKELHNTQYSIHYTD